MYEIVTRILDGFVNCLVPEIGEEVVASSLGITNGRMPLLRQMEKLWALRLDTVVEIGTQEGVMTALLSRFARQVVSLDFGESPFVRPVLEFVGACNVALLPLEKHEMPLLRKSLKFDLAVIGPTERGDGAAWGFTHVKHCGRVFFRGYGASAEPLEVTRLVDSLKTGRVSREEPFAWWSEDEFGILPCGSRGTVSVPGRPRARRRPAK